jgi:probable phosphoglycerate mutase
MILYLARHGQTAYNREGRFQGLLHVPLDDTGREQARALAGEAARHELASLWCSPLARARETADIVAQRIGLPPRDDARLVETDCGDWTGRTFADVRAEDPEGFARFQRTDPTFRFPGGESYAEQTVRVTAALDDVRSRLNQLPALVVTHRVSIRLALVAEHGERERARVIANAELVTL